MKKVLKLILLVAMIASLSVCAFAVESPETETLDVSDVPDVSNAVAEVPEDVTVDIAPIENADSANAFQLAKDTYGEDVVALSSFEITVMKDGEELHGANTGVTVTLDIVVPEEYLGQGYDLVLYEDGVEYARTPIGSTNPITITITSFSTFTPVIVKAAAAPAPTTPQTSPQTMQSILPFALAGLAVLAIAGVLYARKRSFN